MQNLHALRQIENAIPRELWPIITGMYADYSDETLRVKLVRDPDRRHGFRILFCFRDTNPNWYNVSSADERFFASWNYSNRPLFSASMVESIE